MSNARIVSLNKLINDIEMVKRNSIDNETIR